MGRDGLGGFEQLGAGRWDGLAAVVLAVVGGQELLSVDILGSLSECQHDSEADVILNYLIFRSFWTIPAAE